MSARVFKSTVVERSISMTGGLSASATQMTLDSADTLPSAWPYTLVIDPNLTTEEIVTVTSNTGVSNVLNITRAQDGTSAQSHANGSKVHHMITGRDLGEPQFHIENSGAYTITNNGEDPGVTTPTITKSLHGLGATDGSVVGTTKTQTLTNKTISSPTISSPSISNPVLTGTADINGVTAWSDSAWTSYTPTITGWTKSNGTITGSYKKIGRLVFFKGSYTIGSSDTVGASALNISLPVTAADANLMTGHGRGSLTGVGGGSPIIIVSQNSTTTFAPQLLIDSGTAGYSGRTSGITSSNYTKTANDSIFFNGFYESAS